ncbi:hypothetical protein AVKW3434_19855 [Acidovorax sp. SUPP3434]|uniref:hypothetical protein n=1 Tax=Acidovorax sp. SUPP3434 TaxID=2920880 RepID=UPI0023DE1F7F|nr:hypothetical protein [Acidovorax sp. SUPP3434]GKT01682.1 hypothetical protein AVKW3434_19855 [Acidovorax sp. SUPP3434]
MNIIKYTLLTLLTLSLGTGQANAQDSAVYDASLNLWKLYFQDPESSQWIKRTYEARTAIRPAIQSSITKNGKQLTYKYIIRNQRGAKQNISIINIWGIPMVYDVPNLPLITSSAQTENDKWTQQYWDQLTAKRSFEQTVVKAPKGWSAGLRVDEEAGQTSFVWTLGLKDTDSYGIEPGHSQSGFTVSRVELPGIARTYLQGRIAEPWGLDGLPDTPFWKAKVDEIEELDYLLVPVLAPIIPIPDPYNAGELARRLKAHVQTWPKYGHASTDTLARLNRQFDVLIPALEMNNKPTARAAMAALRKECTDLHRDLMDAKAGEDDDTQASVALPRTPAQRSATPAPALDRLAARALIFDLSYLMDRMDSGR